MRSILKTLSVYPIAIAIAIAIAIVAAACSPGDTCPFGQKRDPATNQCVDETPPTCGVPAGQPVSRTVYLVSGCTGEPVFSVAYAETGGEPVSIASGLDGGYTFSMLTCAAYTFEITLWQGGEVLSFELTPESIQTSSTYEVFPRGNVCPAPIPDPGE